MKGGKAMTTEYERLIEMVKKGVPDKEIMKELGIQTKASLKRMYYDALVEAGKIKDILTQRQAKKAKATSRAVSVTKRGTITLSNRLLIENLGFKEGDTFTVSKRKDSIVLRKKQG
jgi:DNA-directed RNA polymerase subunit N (RpoN/RPB10)